MTRLLLSRAACNASSERKRPLRINAAQPQNSPREERLFGVTPAEISVLEACQQLRTANPQALSELLYCTPTTVEHRLARLRAKFKVRDTSGVIVAAYERGLLQPRGKDGPGPFLRDVSYLFPKIVKFPLSGDRASVVLLGV